MRRMLMVAFFLLSALGFFNPGKAYAQAEPFVSRVVFNEVIRQLNARLDRFDRWLSEMAGKVARAEAKADQSNDAIDGLRDEVSELDARLADEGEFMRRMLQRLQVSTVTNDDLYPPCPIDIQVALTGRAFRNNPANGSLDVTLVVVGEARNRGEAEIRFELLNPNEPLLAGNPYLLVGANLTVQAQISALNAMARHPLHAGVMKLGSQLVALGGAAGHYGNAWVYGYLGLGGDGTLRVGVSGIHDAFYDNQQLVLFYQLHVDAILLKNQGDDELCLFTPQRQFIANAVLRFNAE